MTVASRWPQTYRKCKAVIQIEEVSDGFKVEWDRNGHPYAYDGKASAFRVVSIEEERGIPCSGGFRDLLGSSFHHLPLLLGSAQANTTTNHFMCAFLKRSWYGGCSV